MNLYQDEILDHYKHPHNKKRLSDVTDSVEAVNPLCGDKLGLDVKILDGVICEAGYWGEGCAISQASMSMLSDELIGMKVVDLEGITQETILEMLGVSVGPSRLKCALLPLTLVQKILKNLH